MTETISEKKLLLVDGHSLAFRSFYAFSKGGEGGLSTKDGLPTSVTYGFLKALLEICKSFSPQGMVVAFDTDKPTFRHELDENYKANRDVAPEMFFEDLSRLQSILKNKLGLSLSSAPGYEADDVLGTIANQASNSGWQVLILSGDRDLFQLVDDTRKISVLYMGGGPYSKSSSPLLIDEAGVLNKLGVKPTKVVDLKALTGDASDNIPGVKGVGPKTAIKLLNEYNDLDGVYVALESIKEKSSEIVSKSPIKGALTDKLTNDKDKAYLSRELAEILTDIPLPENPSFSFGELDKSGFLSILKELELNSLVRIAPYFWSAFSKGGFNANNKSNEEILPELEADKSKKPSQESTKDDMPNLTPNLIIELDQLDRLVDILLKSTDFQAPVAIDTETTSLNPFDSELVGLGFCWGNSTHEIAYIPIAHKLPDLLLQPAQLELEIVLRKLSEWFKSDKHPKALQNAKYDRLILQRHGILLNGVFTDTLLMDYLRDPVSKHSLEVMALNNYGFTPTSFTDIVPKGKTFSDVPIELASKYCAMDVYLTRKLAIKLRTEIHKKDPKLTQLYENVEKPLEVVLASMESTGITIDVPYLKSLSLELIQTLDSIYQDVRNLSKNEINLSSPKQLGELLFDTLGLDRKKSRRTKTGWSTDATVLEKLEKDHPIVPLIIEHRILSKLLTTYVEALPNLVEEETGRVHTDFNQAVTATGRLSSSNPNLQNIPIKTAFSRRIRKAFLPQKDWILLSADYSQIELRILAHLSKESVLQEAYRKSQDVHALTAQILLDKEEVSSDERRLGKTINFGVIYGMGPNRLARSTGLTSQDAKNFLEKYKSRYKDVFSYLELQERLALTQGYVETILGRRRIFNFDRNGLGRLLGKDPYEIDLVVARRAGMEAQQLRAAANAPIQGSSADIIKVAMVRLHQRLIESKLPARLLLQVHDELVLEVEPGAFSEVETLVTETMQNAVTLSIPLVVETGSGKNWMDAK